MFWWLGCLWFGRRPLYVRWRNLKMQLYFYVRSTVHTYQSRKRSFTKTHFQPEEFENTRFSFSCRRKTFLKGNFETYDVLIIMWFPCLRFFSTTSKVTSGCYVFIFTRRSEASISDPQLAPVRSLVPRPQYFASVIIIWPRRPGRKPYRNLTMLRPPSSNFSHLYGRELILRSFMYWL